MLCRSAVDNSLWVLTANAGDSRGLKYEPSIGKVEQITKDHSLVQKLVDSGVISSDEAFNHPGRNIVTRTVGSLRSPEDVDFRVTPVKNGDIIIMATDGYTDQFDPKRMAQVITPVGVESYVTAQNGIDLKKFANGLAQRAENIQTLTNAPQAKPDDIGIAIMRINVH